MLQNLTTIFIYQIMIPQKQMLVLYFYDQWWRVQGGWVCGSGIGSGSASLVLGGSYFFNQITSLKAQHFKRKFKAPSTVFYNLYKKKE